MNILIIGQGGREHAITYKIAQSPVVKQVFIAPGNAGTALENKSCNVNIDPTDIIALADFARSQAIDITIVGPETPIALGIKDYFEQHNLPCLAPSQLAAQLESSKAYCKQFLVEHDIPTARYASFTDITKALTYLEQHTYPVVIKADGLAAGKGVIIAENYETAQTAVKNMLEQQQFGDASKKIVIEEFLTGTEMSYIVMVDGTHIMPFASSQDYKRRFDHDAGPNTGGMGAISPSPLLTPSLEQDILNNIIQKTVDGLAAQGTPYVGFLYAGLMIDNNNQPKVLEFNCRLGDPETQPLLMRLQSDFAIMCQACINGQLNSITPIWDQRAATNIVMCTEQYPQSDPTQHKIVGLGTPTPESGYIFHAGTSLQTNDTIITSGGRVLSVCALGSDTSQAAATAYNMIGHIQWQGCSYRSDIGKTPNQCALDEIPVQ